MAIQGLSILWKKLELVMVKPTKANITKMKRMAGTAIWISSSSLVKARNRIWGMAIANTALAMPMMTFTFMVNR